MNTQKLLRQKYLSSSEYTGIKNLKAFREQDFGWCSEKQLYININLNSKIMSKNEKSTEKNAQKAKTPKVKKVGVIQTIFNSIEAGPVTQAVILKKLVKAFPDKAEASMQNTIKAQIGSKKRPVRMEREKKITFVIVEAEGKKARTYSLK